MKPDTAYWSIQDNALGNNICGTTMDYQVLPEIGTSQNNYANKWYIGWVRYALCIIPYYGHQEYNILAGVNLNSGTSFNTWYTLDSHGIPTTGWIEVLNSQVGNKVFSAPVPGGAPTDPIIGWEENIVCNLGGCSTTFTQGSGTITYYQNNIVVSGPTAYTGENSNCQYGSVNVYTGYAYQLFNC